MAVKTQLGLSCFGQLFKVCPVWIMTSETLSISHRAMLFFAFHGEIVAVGAQLALLGRQFECVDCRCCRLVAATAGVTVQRRRMQVFLLAHLRVAGRRLAAFARDQAGRGR